MFDQLSLERNLLPLHGIVRELRELPHRFVAIENETLAKSPQPQRRFTNEWSWRRSVVTTFNQRHKFSVLSGLERGVSTMSVVAQDNRVVPHDGLFKVAICLGTRFDQHFPLSRHRKTFTVS